MVDWHQACCRKRPSQASLAPSKRPMPIATSRTRTTLAPSGAAVSRNTFINRLSPCRLPTAFRFEFQTRVSRGRAVEFILAMAMGRGSAGRTPAGRRKDFMGLSRDPHPKSQMFLQTRFDVTPQSPYAPAVESLPPIAGHAANSRQDSRAFNNALASFLFRKITLCAFGVPPFSPGSVMHA